MSKEREISSRWLASESLQPRKPSQLSVLASSLRKSRAERRRELALRLAQDRKPQLPPSQEDPSTPPPDNWRNWRRWPTKWPFWLAVILLLPGSAGFLAIASLIGLSDQNCRNLFLPTASASDRLYCANVLANRRTADDLMKAIEMVNALPKDHPLRDGINRQIERWSQEILKLADVSFQDGRLEEAISMARKLPNDVPAYAGVEKQIQQWQSIWKQAETIYQAAEDYLRQEEWNQAFRQAALLLNLGNSYWETTKYEELTKLIQTARSDGNKLAKARGIAQEGGLENLLEAIKSIGAINPNSYLYQAAQKSLKEFGKKILELAEVRLQEGGWEASIDIANKIPETAGLKEEVKDFTDLARAASQISAGTVAGLENAIKAAQKIGSHRPLYSKVQDYISRWQQEIADVKILERARQLAMPGGISDLKAAIAQVQTIPGSNPRGPEAQKELDRWSRQVELMEDKPILDRAEQLAIAGDTDSLDAAIAEARKISRGRGLYEDAQAKIQKWMARNQQILDRPFLDRAEQLAANGNLVEAISAAEQVQPGRTLYQEARANIQKWQSQLQGQQSLQNARQAAQPGTADALETAIMLANQIPTSSPQRWEADEAINEWSQRILGIGLEQATVDIPGAIAILQKIPPGTPAHTEAQSQISTLQESLNASPTPSAPPLEENPTKSPISQPKFPQPG